jgi:molybdopterin-dependent oxidoreductase alpha subunit
MRSGGGLRAILYTLQKARQSGGVRRFYRRMALKNACKTCALGMGGQLGGMRNEQGRFPEFCKKSVQAQAADMQPPIPHDWFARHTLSELERWTPRELEYAGRIGFPLHAAPGDAHFRRVGWDEALDRIAAALRNATPERAMFYSSGRASNEAAFLLQWLARAYGTNHVNNCSYYCHSASGVGLSRALGSGTGTVDLDDLERADFAIVLGANPASNHPRLITQLVDLRARGGRVVIVNPIRETGLVRFRIPSRPLSLLFGSRVSDRYLQPRVGGDIALLVGMVKRVLERGAEDRGFIERHTTGFAEVERAAREASWRDLEEGSGLRREEMEEVADLYAASKNAILFWAMGITHHEHGVQNVLALANLALVRGMIGRPGAGLCPIRGHSNVQGVGSVGFTPELKQGFREAMQREFGIQLPRFKGYTTYESMVAAAEGRLDFAFLLGGNLYGSNPDLAFAGRALRNIGLTVYVSTKLNPGHVHGRGRESLVLPALARDEERQATSQESRFSFVRLSEGGAPAPTAEMRSEVDIIGSIARRVLPPSRIPWEDLTDHAVLRAAIGRIVPGYAPLGEIDRTKKEFTVAGRIRHTPEFPTPDGRARFHATPLPAPADDGALALMTVRSEGQFNTVVYEEEDVYRGQERRDVVMLHPQDAARLGLHEDQRVRVIGEAGVLESLLVRFLDVAPGTAVLYYPEANALLARRIDAASGTPAFKHGRVRLEPMIAAPGRADPVAAGARS